MQDTLCVHIALKEFLNDLLQNAAAEGLTYSDVELQEILADSERLGLFG